MLHARLTSLVAVLAALLSAVGASPSARDSDPLIVGCAASLTDVMKPLFRGFMKLHPGASITPLFESSGQLQAQIEQGAPVDVFVSAGNKEMDKLEGERLVVGSTRKSIAGNEMALIAPRFAALRRWDQLSGPAIKRVAISDPKSVPSGRYAEQTLNHRHLWNALQPKLILGQNVRQTLAYAESGDVDAAVVFRTDARQAGDKIREVALANARDHEPITYPAAVVKASHSSELAKAFVTYLRSKEAQTILRSFGFTPPHA